MLGLSGKNKKFLYRMRVGILWSFGKMRGCRL